ncbi:MAG: stage III sporulation protein AG [Clostridia bacterium]|nr:stage III sporulation protein AG [Clostridia bacterium]
MNFTDKIKQISEKLKTSKNIEFLIALLIVGVIISIAASVFLEGDKNQQEDITADDKKTEHQEISGDYLEDKLENVLSQIQGAGQVSVMITYESGPEIVAAYESSETNNTTEEKGEAGISKTTKQRETNKKPAELQNQGSTSPMILKEKQPEIRGVIVVAQGANDIKVKMELTTAVKTVLNIPVHKVKVCTKKN